MSLWIRHASEGLLGQGRNNRSNQQKQYLLTVSDFTNEESGYCRTKQGRIWSAMLLQKYVTPALWHCLIWNHNISSALKHLEMILNLLIYILTLNIENVVCVWTLGVWTLGVWMLCVRMLWVCECWVCANQVGRDLFWLFPPSDFWCSSTWIPYCRAIQRPYQVGRKG